MVSELFFNHCENGNLPAVLDILPAVEHESDVWNYGLYAGCIGGHMHIVKFMINKGGSCWIPAARSAIHGNHLSILQVIEQHCDTLRWNDLFSTACLSGNMLFIEYTFERYKLMPNYRFDGNVGLIHACKQGHLHIVKFLVDTAAAQAGRELRWDRPLTDACDGNQIEIVNYMVSNNLKTWNDALMVTSKIEIFNAEFVHKLIERGATQIHILKPANIVALLNYDLSQAYFYKLWQLYAVYKKNTSLFHTLRTTRNNQYTNLCVHLPLVLVKLTCDYIGYTQK